MKVSELKEGCLYRVSQNLQVNVRPQRSDDNRRSILPPLNLISFMGWGYKGRPTELNPAMLYLGVKYTETKVWGQRKFHWFLMNGSEVGMLGQEMRYIDPV